MQSDRVQEWADRQATPNEYGTLFYSEFTCHIANMLDPRSRENCECRWVAPYGWVPEAGCPAHDG
jgi:hypothetical protein